MLDDTQPTARLLAQMRATMTKQKLPDAYADIFAQHPGMTAARAEALAKPLKELSQVISHLGVDQTAVAQIVSDYVAEAGDETSFAALHELALNKVNAVWKDQGDIDIPMHGAPVHNPIGRSFEQGPDMRAKMVEGLLARLDPKGATAMGRDAAQMTMTDIAMTVCRAQGLRPMNEAEAVRMAAHSTSDFPLILENTMTGLIARRLEQRMPDLVRASHEVSRMDYRSGNSLSLSATGMPQEVSEGGEVQFVTAEEKGEALPMVRDFASGFNLTNKALVNDGTALGLLNDIGNRMTQGAIERLRRVLLEPIHANAGAGQTMADGVPMFNAAHGNLAGTAAPITIASLSTARTAMRKQVGQNGEILAIEPWGLVVPAELETVAQQVIATINANKFSDANPFANTLEIIVEPGLTSASAWYLIGDPSRYDGLAHAFLDGQRAPRVESRAGWNTLGMEMRLTWALDAKFIETATWFKNAGT